MESNSKENVRDVVKRCSYQDINLCVFSLEECERIEQLRTLIESNDELLPRIENFRRQMIVILDTLRVQNQISKRFELDLDNLENLRFDLSSAPPEIVLFGVDSGRFLNGIPMNHNSMFVQAIKRIRCTLAVASIPKMEGTAGCDDIPEIVQPPVPTKAEMEAEVKELIRQQQLNKPPKVKSLRRTKPNKNLTTNLNREFRVSVKECTFASRLPTPCKEVLAEIRYLAGERRLHRSNVKDIPEKLAKLNCSDLAAIAKIFHQHCSTSATAYGFIHGEILNFAETSPKLRLKYCLRPPDFFGLDQLYQKQLAFHYRVNEHHPEHNSGGAMSISGTIEMMNDLVSSAMRLDEINNCYEAVMKAMEWIFNIREGFPVTRKKFEGMNKDGFLLWIVGILNMGISNVKIPDVVKMYTRIRKQDRLPFENEVWLSKLAHRPMQVFLDAIKCSPKLKAYIRETKIHMYIVNGMNSRFKISQHHDKDKLSHISIIAYTWNWFVRDAPVVTVEGTMGDEDPVKHLRQEVPEQYRRTIYDVLKERRSRIEEPPTDSTEGIRVEEQEDPLNPFQRPGESDEAFQQRAKRTFMKSFMGTFGNFAGKTKDQLDDIMIEIRESLCRFSTACGSFTEAINSLRSMLEAILKQFTKAIESIVGTVKNFKIDYLTAFYMFVSILIWHNTDSLILRSLIVSQWIYKFGVWSKIWPSLRNLLFGEGMKVATHIENQPCYSAPPPEPEPTHTSGDDDEESYLSYIFEQIMRVDPQSIGIISAVVVSLVTGYALTRTDLEKLKKKGIEYFKDLHFIGAGLFGVDRMIKYFGAMFKTSIEFIKKKVTGFTSEEEEARQREEEATEVLKWISRIEAYRTEEGIRLMRSSKAHFEEAMALYNDSLKFTMNVASGKYPREMASAITARMRDARDIFNIGMRLKRFGSPRVTPFHIQFESKPGTGKSVLLQNLIDWIGETYYSDVPRDQLRYTRTASEFWDGYNNQPIIVKDEAYPAKLPELLIEDLSIVSCNPFMTPQAELRDKGNVYLNSSWYLTCTNIKYPECGDVYCMEAIHRRRHLLVEVEIDKRVYNESTKSFDPKMFEKIYPGQDSRNFPHLSFNICKPVRNGDDPESIYYFEEEGLPPGLTTFSLPLKNLSYVQLKSVINASYNARKHNETSAVGAVSWGEKMELDFLEIYNAIDVLREKGYSKFPRIFDENYMRDEDFKYLGQDSENDKLTEEDLESIFKEMHLRLGKMRRYYETQLNNDKPRYTIEEIEEHYNLIMSDPTQIRNLTEDFVNFVKERIVVPGLEPREYRMLAIISFNLWTNENLPHLDGDGSAASSSLSSDINDGIDAELARLAEEEREEDPLARVQVFNGFEESAEEEEPSFTAGPDGISNQSDPEVEAMLRNEHLRRVDILRRKRQGKYNIDERGRILGKDVITPTSRYFADEVIWDGSENLWAIHKDMVYAVPVQAQSVFSRVGAAASNPITRIFKSGDINQIFVPFDLYNRGMSIYLTERERSLPIWQGCRIINEEGMIPIHTGFVNSLRKIENQPGRWFIAPEAYKSAHLIAEMLSSIGIQGWFYERSGIEKALILSVPHMEHSCKNFMDVLTEDQREYLYARNREMSMFMRLQRNFQACLAAKFKTWKEKIYDKWMQTKTWIFNKFKEHWGKILAAGTAIALFFGCRSLFSLFAPKYTSRTHFRKVMSKFPLRRGVFTSGDQHPLDDLDRYIRENIVEYSIRNEKTGKAVKLQGLRTGKFLITAAHGVDSITEPDFAEGDDEMDSFIITLRPTTMCEEEWSVRVGWDHIHYINDSDVAVVYLNELAPKRSIMHLFYTSEQLQHMDLPDCGYLTYKSKGQIYKEGGKIKEFSIMEMKVGSILNQGPYIKFSFHAPQTSSGSPLILGYSGHDSARIPGIQSAVWQGSSYIACFSREDIESAMELFEGSIEHQGPHTVIEGVPTCLGLVESHIDVCGMVPSGKIVGLMGKTAFSKTALFDYFGSENIPAILNPRDKSPLVKVHPLKHSLNKTGRGPMKPLPRTEKEHAIISMTHFLCQILDLSKIRVLNLDESIVGLPYGCEPMNLKTSPGIPYVWRSHTYPGKKDYIRISEEGSLEYIDPVLREDIALTEFSMQDGVIPPAQMYEFPKDELRPIKKVLGDPVEGTPPKTRSISVFPMAFNILYRKYFLAFDALMQIRADGRWPFFVGVNPDSIAWTNSYMRLRSKSEKGIDIDVSNWDGYWTAELAFATLTVVNGVYEWAHRLDCAFCQSAGPHDVCNAFRRDTMVRKCLVEFCLFGTFQFEDGVFVKQKGMSSGFGGTAALNTYSHVLLVYIAYLKNCWKEPELCTFEQFLDKVGLECYGDDQRMAISDEILHLYDYQKHCFFLREYGLPVTSGQKESEITPRPIEDLVFLKRHYVPDFRLGKAFMWGALDKKTIVDLFCWMRKSTQPFEQLKINLETALEYAHSWGPEYYNEIFIKLVEALRKEGIPLIVPTFRETRRKMLSRVFPDQ